MVVSMVASLQMIRFHWIKLLICNKKVLNINSRMSHDNKLISKQFDPPEHINTFIARNGLAVDYIDPNYVYGRYNNLFGNWSGMIGHVRK